MGNNSIFLIFVLLSLTSHLIVANDQNIVLTSDQSWGGEKNLSGNVIIPKGLTLTILPNTTLAATNGIHSTIWVSGTLKILGKSHQACATLNGPISIQSDGHKASVQIVYCHFNGTSLTFSNGTFKNLTISNSIFTAMPYQDAPNIRLSLDENQTFKWSSNIISDRVSLNIQNPNEFKGHFKKTIFTRNSHLSIQILPLLKQCDLYSMPISINDKNKQVDNSLRMWKNIYCKEPATQKYLKATYTSIYLSEKPFNVDLLNIMKLVQNDAN